MTPSQCQRRHSAHEDSLEDAVALATRAENVHRQDDAWPHGLSDELAEILDLTVAHQQREQAVVFPILMTGVDALPATTVEDMVGAHEDLIRRWRAIDRRTRGFEPPAHACATWRNLYLLCRALDVDCRVQVDVENRMLLAGRPADLRNDTEARFARAQHP
jgi:regulator of cell morphogenesis and NO signaling